MNEKIQHPSAGRTDNFADVLGLQPVGLDQGQHGINGAMGLTASRVGLDTNARRANFVGRAQILDASFRRKLSSPDKSVKKSKTTVENLGLCRETTLR